MENKKLFEMAEAAGFNESVGIEYLTIEFYGNNCAFCLDLEPLLSKFEQLVREDERQSLLHPIESAQKE